jgi:hypothetical protein
MAILGYDTKGASASAFGTNLMFASKWTLASSATLTELHGWFGGNSTNVIVAIWADSAGAPSTRLAYTSPLALTGSDIDLNQTGFSVSLAAGDYWIGCVSQDAGSSGVVYRDTGGVAHATKAGTGFNPPDNPFGTPDGSGTRRYSCWAVVGAPAADPANYAAAGGILIG